MIAPPPHAGVLVKIHWFLWSFGISASISYRKSETRIWSSAERVERTYCSVNLAISETSASVGEMLGGYQLVSKSRL